MGDCIKKISREDYYLGVAEAVLRGSTCLRRQYGAIIVNNDEIIASGYNGAPRKEPNCSDSGYCEREALNIPKGEQYEKCVAVHAEQNCLISAARRDCLGGTLYIVGKEVRTGEYANPAPCLICRRMLKNSGITTIIGRAEDGSIIDLSNNLMIGEVKV